MTSSTGALRPLLLGLGIMLVAFNMRPALTSVGPLLDAIRTATGLGNVGAAYLTTLPVLCIGLACTLGPVVIRRLGADRGVLLAVAVVALGSGLRGLGGLEPLFIGACLAAFGIGLSGVLLPGLVKREFPARVGLMTGLYTMVLCLGAAAGAGFSVPLARATDSWSFALGLWGLPALMATLAWIPFARRPDPAERAVRRRPLWRDPLAWQVTGFMGLQSSLAYILFGWLPVVLQSRGLDATEAGFVASLMSIGQAPFALLVPSFAARAKDQRLYAAALLALAVMTILGLVFGPLAFALPFGMLLGGSLGGLFGLGLTIIVLRARDTAGAADLAAMSQSVGYTLASLGPLGFGLAHDLTGGWGASVALFCLIAAAAWLCSLGAGRNRTVGTR
ncbi:CynX/NimT family MFS transporter [Methylobacterium gossipiicola]|uniref:MFS transporter, CP family, cyanate transporter n=1 Tax=Methylobacterium gossipiicola TaxID=582675 RepID=A0A1I2QEK6_9HYPH|nr:MFS transporter [Methylobacterium gossipiicola]SFG25789.1 MFS transporter, CP family, cyanate transporter [Methylobacterium gossipiicola]